MKKLIYSILVVVSLLTLDACQEKFFETPPLGQASNVQLQSRAGIDALLVGAYSLLDGVGASINGGRGSDWQAASNNWWNGDIPSGDAYKGSSPADQSDITPFERYNPLPTNSYLDPKWRTLFDGVSRSNVVLKAIKGTSSLDESTIKRFTSEARFLRGYYYFELRKIFKNVPYVDETTLDTRVSNTQEIWPKIEADFTFAAGNLPETQDQVGRVNAWAAKAFLAKTYLFQSKFSEAKSLLDAIITNGKTTNGLKYGLSDCFQDVFDLEKKNGKESVFAVQMSVNDGSPESDNGNFGSVLNYGIISEAGSCCNFFRPSQNLVNAYKTDATGLPLLNTFNETDVKNDEGLNSDQPYAPDISIPLDPRLDWTVGRRGIPYLDWGVNPGQVWVTSSQLYYGPYIQAKFMFKKSQKGKFTTNSGWAQTPNAQNLPLIRFADVLLWAAECEVEVGDLNKARDYVNQVRRRAKNGCYVMSLDANGTPTTKPAANYQIDEYKTAWTSKEVARSAVRFERRLELALEGHRFYDLVRWGIADQVLSTYITKESLKRTYLTGVVFTKGKNEYLPIPQVQIINSYQNGQPTLTQNPGY